MKSTKNAEKLFDAITDIREDYILEATEHEFKQAAAKKPWTARRAFRYAGPIAAAFCIRHFSETSESPGEFSAGYSQDQDQKSQ